MNYSLRIFRTVLLIGVMAFVNYENRKPLLFLIGDSTVANESANDSLYGWGKVLPSLLDTSRVGVRNYAIGGTSSRTYQTRGYWNNVCSQIKSGDLVIIQFGINDQSKINDSTRARGTLKGVGSDSIQIQNILTKKAETVYSFGYYLRAFIKQARAHGAKVIVCSTVPLNEWKNGKLIRGGNGFAMWALQVAKEEKVFSIDLNTQIADIYDREGENAVTTKYNFGKDRVHTSRAGAELNASVVADNLKRLFPESFD